MYNELIHELFQVKTMDEAKQLIKNGSFTEIRQNYESDSVSFKLNLEGFDFNIVRKVNK